MACHRENISVCEYEIPPPQSLQTPMFVKEKRLLGAGPSNPPNTVLSALSKPMMGHLHPETVKVKKIIFFYIYNIFRCEKIQCNNCLLISSNEFFF